MIGEKGETFHDTLGFSSLTREKFRFHRALTHSKFRVHNLVPREKPLRGLCRICNYPSHTVMLVSPTLPIYNSHTFTLLSCCSCSGDGHQADAVLQTVFLKIKKSLPGPSEFWDVKFKRLLWSRWEPWQQMLTLPKAGHRIEKKKNVIIFVKY